MQKRQLLARQVEGRDCDLALYLNGSKDGQESFVLDGRAMGQVRAMQPRTAAGAPAARPALELPGTSGCSAWVAIPFILASKYSAKQH